MAIVSLVFFAGAFATAAAAVVPRDRGNPGSSSGLGNPNPTHAIFAVLIAAYASVFTLGIIVYDAFQLEHRSSWKFYVTLGIAVVALTFTKLRGARIIRDYFGATGGRNVELTARQSLYVVIFVICVGLYTAWLLL